MTERRLAIWRVVVALAVVLVLFSGPDNRPAYAEPVQPAPLPDNQDARTSTDKTTGLDAILNMDVEQLQRTPVHAPSMDIAVSSVARQESTVGQSPAAVFVITNEMIRRSGYKAVPDLLRLAPGVSVSKITSSSWAIGIRGGPGRFVKQLLVMIDGRAVYNPLFGGIYWDMQDLLLEDIDRIEVIRGPGATVWGANAMDGVVNIITKKASKTQRTYVTAGGGNYDVDIEGFRVGGSNGKGMAWRVWGKHTERGPGYLEGLGLAYDDWRSANTGFRVDYHLDPQKRDRLVATGSYFLAHEGQRTIFPLPDPPYSETATEDMKVASQNVVLRWEHKISDESDWSFQTYYDRCYRQQLAGEEMWTTADFDFQHRFPLGARHDVIWGLEYRDIGHYDPNGSFFLSFSPERMRYNMFSAFIQDRIELVEDRLYLTAGTKLERNCFSGFEVQPSIRLLWSPDKHHVVWGAISRALSTPMLYQETGELNLGPMPSGLPLPLFARLNGSNNFRSEKLMAYEIGYRTQVNKQFAWDIATYYNDYRDFHGLVLGVPFLEGNHFITESDWLNRVAARGYGVELTASWDATDTWRLTGFYSYQYVSFAGSHDEELIYPNSIAPQNMARLQSSWTLPGDLEFDAALRYVDNISGVQVPRYLTMDLRLAWHPSKNLEMAVAAQNLFDRHHYEYANEVFNLGATQVRRAVFGQLTWRR
ncbi:MAG: TonB-dependent receptor [Pirellulales bacterium]|nr:TonB-dependent receptor [Pirellulales bacterium]